MDEIHYKTYRAKMMNNDGADYKDINRADKFSHKGSNALQFMGNRRTLRGILPNKGQFKKYR